MEWAAAPNRCLQQRLHQREVFSGDVVSVDHLKNQYGLVVGAEGVARLRRIVALGRLCRPRYVKGGALALRPRQRHSAGGADRGHELGMVRLANRFVSCNGWSAHVVVHGSVVRKGVVGRVGTDGGQAQRES